MKMDREKVEVVISPFIMFDSATGEAIWYKCPPCPRCNFKMVGELAGAFECEICGYAEIPEYSSAHGYHLSREAV